MQNRFFVCTTRSKYEFIPSQSCFQLDSPTEPRTTEPRMGLLSEWTQPRMGLNLEWTQPRLGLNLEWTQPRMDFTPNGT